MNGKLLALAYAILPSLGGPAAAHRLDEYLQATLISIDENRVQAQMRLTPGVAVSSIVLAGIDTDSDAVISETERRTYARQVLHDLSLTLDGDTVQLQLISMTFPSVADMKEGLGEIRIEFGATLPRGGAARRLVFENHHLSRIAAYLVNCEAPRDPNIRIVAQRRNETQSVYRLDYALGAG